MKLPQEVAVDFFNYIIIERKLKDGTRFLLCYINNMINSDILNIKPLPAIMEISGKNFDYRRIPAAPIREGFPLTRRCPSLPQAACFSSSKAI